MKHIKEELWKPLVFAKHPDLNDKYEISNLGNCRSMERVVDRTHANQGTYIIPTKNLICQTFARNEHCKGQRHGARALRVDAEFPGANKRGRKSVQFRIDELMKVYWPESKYTEKNWAKHGSRQTIKKLREQGHFEKSAKHLEKYWENKYKPKFKKERAIFYAISTVAVLTSLLAIACVLNVLKVF